MQSPSGTSVEKSGCTARQQGPREGFKAEKGQGQLCSLQPRGVSEEGRNDTGKDPLGWGWMQAEVRRGSRVGGQCKQGKRGETAGRGGILWETGLAVKEALEGCRDGLLTPEWQPGRVEPECHVLGVGKGYHFISKKATRLCQLRTHWLPPMGFDMYLWTWTPDQLWLSALPVSYSGIWHNLFTYSTLHLSHLGNGDLVTTRHLTANSEC